MYQQKRTLVRLATSTFPALLGASLAMVACDRGEAGVEGAAVEGQVVERTIQNTDTQNIGTRDVEEGEAEVSVRRRVVVRQMEEMDLPTVKICEEYADLNELGADQLAALGVTQSAAQAIVQYREENGAFASLNQLTQVEGVDSNVLGTLRDAVAVTPQEKGQRGNGQEG